MLALLLQGALSQRATNRGFVDSNQWCSAGRITAIHRHYFYYIAFISFCYSMLAMWLLSFTTGLPADQLANSPIAHSYAGATMIQWLQSMPEWGNYVSMLLFCGLGGWFG